MLNVPVRCSCFLSLIQHRAGLRNSKAVGAVSCHWDRRGSGNSARLRRIRVVTCDSDRTESAEGMVSPVARLHGYLGILEIETITPTPRGRNIGVHGSLKPVSHWAATARD